MEVLINLINRDLDKLVEEINSFSKEAKLWYTDGDIKNSAGNLTLHLVGNLNHFIGAVIGKTGYVRNRDAEFSDKNVPKAKLISMVKETKDVVNESLNNMNKDLLKGDYPIEVFGSKMTYEYFLIHLITHLNYHLGQINYLRRLKDY